jgi:hypothetical protein
MVEMKELGGKKWKKNNKWGYRERRIKIKSTLYYRYVAGIKTISFKALISFWWSLPLSGAMLKGIGVGKKVHKQGPLFTATASSRTRESFLPCFRCRQLSFLDLYLQKIVSLTNFYRRGFCTFQIRSSLQYHVELFALLFMVLIPAIF